MERKIVLIGPAWPLRGGIANFNEALCVSLQQSGADVHIVSFSLQYPSLLFPGKSQLENDSRSDPGLPIKELINSINPISWFRAARYINRLKPDYVLVRYWLPFMAISLGSILRLLNKEIRIIALVDNAIPHEKRFGDYQLTKYFVQACNGFVAMSRSVLNDLSQFTNTDFKSFVPHPVYNIYGEAIPKSIARSKLNLPANEKIILFFGFIRKYKGLQLLLEAMSDKRLEAFNLKLIVAGEFYEDRNKYDAVIEKYNLSQRVIFHDAFIPSNRIAEYFCSADMVVQTYLNATQSGVTQIAYHFGRPMLVTNVGGLAEIVPNLQAGYVCDIDAVRIADALNDFYLNHREEEMAKFVQEKAKDFTWQAMVKEIDKLYLELVKQ